MSGLTASRNTPEWNGAPRFHYGLIPVEASTSIYVGGMVGLNSNGNGVPAQARGTSPLDELRILGICEYVYAGGIQPPGVNALNQSGLTYNNIAAGTAGAISIGVICSIFGMDNDSSIAQANVGEMCFAADDHTVSLGTLVANTTSITVPSSGVLINVLQPDILPGTFAAYSATSAGGTHYKEGTDFAVDYQAGLFITLSGGAISAGGTVYVTYYHAGTKVAAGRIIGIDANLVYVSFLNNMAAP
jgi:hypothetical protein